MENVNAAKEARRTYFREWQRKNREKVKKYQDRYWAKKAAEMESKKHQEQEGV